MDMGILRRIPGVVSASSVGLVPLSVGLVVEGAVEGAVVGAVVDAVVGAVVLVVDAVVAAVVVEESGTVSVSTLPEQPQAVIIDATSIKIAIKIPAFFIVILLAVWNSKLVFLKMKRLHW